MLPPPWSRSRISSAAARRMLRRMSPKQNPEQIARDAIDAQLRFSGWAVQSKDASTSTSAQVRPSANTPPPPGRPTTCFSSMASPWASSRPRRRHSATTSRRPPRLAWPRLVRRSPEPACPELVEGPLAPRPSARPTRARSHRPARVPDRGHHEPRDFPEGRPPPRPHPDGHGFGQDLHRPHVDLTRKFRILHPLVHEISGFGNLSEFDKPYSQPA